MTKFIKGALLLAAVCLITSMFGLSFAQDEDTQYSYGTVKSASSNEIIVIEYDYDEGKDADIVYAVNSQTELNNVSSVKEITAGDNVDVEYVVNNDKRIAKVIDVGKQLVEDAYDYDEYVPLEMESEEAESFPEETQY